MNGRFILYSHFTETFPSMKRYFVQLHFVSEAVNRLLCLCKAYTIFSLKQQRHRALPFRLHVTFQSTVLRFATLVRRWQLEPKCVPQLFLGLLLGKCRLAIGQSLETFPYVFANVNSTYSPFLCLEWHKTNFDVLKSYLPPRLEGVKQQNQSWG